MLTRPGVWLGIALMAWGLPGVALAQTGIAGVVTDTSGAVVPGVTIEAASPVLIEKVRTAVSNDQGQYRIVDLRPGVYTVTFSLAGFNTVIRDGIELRTNFTAPLNVEMRVGAIEETVTVSGQSPVVDVQNVIQERVINAEVVAALPTARSQQTIAALIPGMVTGAVSKAVTQDVGGSAGEYRQTIAIHGGRQRDMIELIDGIPQNGMVGVWTGGINMDTGAVQEFSYELGAIAAESATGGVRVNAIPKDGGNRLSGLLFGAYANGALQSSNASDDLVSRGLPEVNELVKVYDVNPALGGPLFRDKLWFYGSTRYWGLEERVAGMFFDQNPTDFVFTPDPTRRAIDTSWLASGSMRLTWQVSPKNKVAIFAINQGRCNCYQGVSNTRAPEATNQQRHVVDYLTQATWNAPLTSRILLEAGGSRYRFKQGSDPQPGVPEDTFSVLEQSTNTLFRASTGYSWHDNWVYNSRASLSYVTGTHTAKVGFTLQQGHHIVASRVNNEMTLQFLSGLPRSVTVNATPLQNRTDLNAALGVFAQDQWTLRRLTVNGGVRYDHHRSSVPEQHLPPVRFVGPRDFAAVENVPNWHDLSPRLGASYDVFGTGKTALKMSVSRYVASETLDFAKANNPVNTSVNSASRTWNDLNRDFTPQENELGAPNPSNFGQLNIVTRYADDLREGFGKRGYNWETSAGLQHELMSQVSVSATYFRRTYGNFTVTDNLLVSAADHDPFCVAVPSDARLPGAGSQLCGLYDVNPSRFGLRDNLVTFAKDYGDMYENWNGVDVSVNARLPRLLLAGGLSTGKTTFDNCDVAAKVDNPAQTVGLVTNTATATTVASPSSLYCHQETPYLTQVKFLGSTTLMWDIQASATFQTAPGPEILAAWTAPNELIRPSLGRNLSSGPQGTAAVHLVPPGSLYGERLHQIDARLAKIFRVGRYRIQGNFDLYNVLNANPVLLQNNTFGPAWQRPTSVLPGRLVKFGGQLDF